MFFKDSILQQAFDRDGYVTFSLLNENEVCSLKDFYDQSFHSDEPGFYSSSFLGNEAQRSEINRGIEELIRERINSICLQHKRLGACFLTKNTGAQGEMPLHQDWTIVDESRFQAMTIWIPLQDVNEHNGALKVVPGSHRFSQALRGPSLNDPYNDLRKSIRDDAILVPLKKGEAIAFSHALLHSSPPNLSPEIRIAVTYGLIPEDAEMCFYHHAGQGVLEKYDVEPDFFHRYNTMIGQAPSWLKPSQTLRYQEEKVSMEQYNQGKRNYQKQKSMETYRMKPVLKDAERQQFFEKNGYVVLPVLGQDKVQQLKSYYENSALAKEQHEGFHVSMDSSDKEFCRTTRDFVWGLVLPEMERYLTNFKPFVASYTAKEPSPRGIVPPHQDWSFADGEKEGNCSITCWIALVDTTLDNGALGVIPGTHQLMQNHRPSPSPQTPVPLANHMFALFPYTQLIEMKAGEMLMFDNRTFHASPPNITQFTRLAVGVGITQLDSNLVHYYLKPNGKKDTLLKYMVDEEFFIRYDNARLSKMYENGELIEGYGKPTELPYQYDDWDRDTILQEIQNLGATINSPLRSRMEELFPQMYIEKPRESLEPELVTVSDSGDSRTFFEKYTPLNIYREIKYKLGLN